MPIVSLTFGSFGDIATILQLAWAIRRALSENAGTSAQIRTLVADLDAFTRALQEIKAALERHHEQALRNGVAHALQECITIMSAVQRRIDSYQAKIAGAVGVAVWRKYWAASAWEILGGRREIESMKARLFEQVDMMHILLAASTARDLERIATAAEMHQRNTDDTLLMVLRSLQGMLLCPSTSTSSFVFLDKEGAQRLPIVSIPLAFVGSFDIDDTMDRIGGVQTTAYVTVMAQYDLNSFDLHLNFIASCDGHVLGDYDQLPWSDVGSRRCALGGFVHLGDGMVYLSDVMQLKSDGPSVAQGSHARWTVDPCASGRLACTFRTPYPNNKRLDPWVRTWKTASHRTPQAALQVSVFQKGLSIVPVMTALNTFSCVYRPKFGSSRDIRVHLPYIHGCFSSSANFHSSVKFWAGRAVHKQPLANNSWHIPARGGRFCCGVSAVGRRRFPGWSARSSS